MTQFQILEHRADLKIRVFGKDLKELFSNAALAMADQQNPDAREKTKEKEEWESVEITSPDLESLLVDWLSEILSRSDTYQKVYFDFKIEKLTQKQLKARIRGVSVEQKRIDIKAVTHHELKIEKTDDLWRATIIFDI
jgi:SHS2 domain-containing protein